MLAKDMNKEIKSHPLGLITKENFVAAPDTVNMFHWYFVVFGLSDEYKNGFYMGKIEFPDNYPWKPPVIKAVTETGRFLTNASICLSISHYHPESWDPVWTVRTIIIGFISFMVSNQDTLNSIISKKSERVKIA